MSIIDDLFVMQVPLAEKIARTVAVYVIIFLLFRVTGKRGLANLNTFDFVVIFLLSNVVQNAIIGQDNSLLGGAIGAATLVVVNSAVNRMLARSSRFARIVEGKGTDVVVDGAVDGAALRRLAVRVAELDHAVRQQNGDQLSDAETVRMEPSGQLVVTLKSGQQGATRDDIASLHARIDQLVAAVTGLRDGDAA